MTRSVTEPVTRLLVADAQVFQTVAWHRGMGKYSLELLSALDADAAVQLRLVFSSRLPADPAMLEQVRRRVPRADHVRLDLLPASTTDDAGTAAHNRRILHEYLADLPGAEFLVLSALQGIIRPAIPRVAGLRTHALVYDLIPLMFPEVYLRDPAMRAEYLPRLADLSAADRLLTISRTVANDVAGWLGVAPDRIASIDGAPIGHAPEPVHYAGVREPFVLMPTGNDLRKNNRRAIRAFDRFNRGRDRAYTLVVTSTFQPDQVAALSALCPDVRFTGNISGAELADLYRRAAAVLFPPEYEGLGLPVLEAMQAGRPVACSDIPVFREISETGMQMFDPLSVRQIADALAAAVDQGTNGADSVDLAEYRRTLDRFTWQRTARDLLATLDQEPDPRPTRRCRVVVTCPDSGPDSTIGRFVEQLHAELARRAEVRYLVGRNASDHADGPRSTLLGVAGSAGIGPGAILPEPAEAVVHHLGADPRAGTVLLAACALPGVVVVHDTDLTEPWEALLAAGLVDADRIAAEDRLEELTAVPGTAHLAGAVAGARAVVVLTEPVARSVRVVLARLDRDVPVYLIPAGTPALRYPQVRPPRTTVATSGPPIPGAPLREDLDRLARSWFAVFPRPTAVPEVLRAMRWGVIPVLGFDPIEVGLPDDVCLRFEPDLGAETVTAPVLADPEQLALLSERVRLHAATVHAPDRWAERLLAAVTATAAGGSGGTDPRPVVDDRPAPPPPGEPPAQIPAPPDLGGRIDAVRAENEDLVEELRVARADLAELHARLSTITPLGRHVRGMAAVRITRWDTAIQTRLGAARIDPAPAVPAGPEPADLLAAARAADAESARRFGLAPPGHSRLRRYRRWSRRFTGRALAGARAARRRLRPAR